MRDKQSTTAIGILGAVVAVWLGLLIAPYSADGLVSIVSGLAVAMSNPFSITFCAASVKTVLIALVCYALALGVMLSTKHNYRRGEEHGSASWGNPRELGQRYRDRKAPERNKILTQNVSMGLDGKKHRRNLNTVVVGGSGSGKTRGFAEPNAMQDNDSMVILDPKGEILRAVGDLKKQQGYEVRVLDLINMERSHSYNPFVYLETESDVQKLVTNIFKATTPKGSQSNDPFWDNAASMLLSAIIFYLLDKAPPEEQTFAMVLEMLRAADVDEENSGMPSPVDALFQELEGKEHDHIAVKYYNLYRKGAGKTLKSIQITLAARLEKFNIEALAKLTSTDELDLPSLGERKVALFALIPDNDTSFNFLVSVLYTQLFQQLFYSADHREGGSLKVPVHFLMDEFANVSLPDDFDKILATMRSRGVYVSIILQNIAQLKALFEKQWESIMGNCDEFLYLGGFEQSTHEYVSKLLGKETIDINSYGKSTGRNGNYSTNYQLAGRELMTPDEVARLDNRYSLLFLRGERPIKDLKYDLMKHPNIGQTEMGGAEPYDHGKITASRGSVKRIVNAKDARPIKVKARADDYAILTSDQLEEYYKFK